MQQPDFEEVYREHYRPVFAYVHKHLSIEADAEDLTASVFTMAWRAWDRYDPEKCPIRAWLYIIASNLLKNHYRDRKEHLSLDNEETAAAVQVRDDSFEEAQKLMALREVLAEAIEILEERERTIIINRYFCDMSNAELAKRLGLSEGNVRVIATRAMKKMRAYLEKNQSYR